MHSSLNCTCFGIIASLKKWPILNTLQWEKCYTIVVPIRALYGVENPIYAIMQLGQTTMRSELGKITLDKTFEEQDMLNENVVKAINEAATDWGLQCMRYEIRNISLPPGVR